jgi:predicted enzyme related to lactoylglutathione lyase
MSNRVTWFELAAAHPEANMKFYRDAFGWQFLPSGKDNSWDIRTGDEDDPGINGTLIRRSDSPQPLVTTITVPDIAQAIRRIDHAGGHMVMPKTAVPSIGWVAQFTDPEGNLFEVMEEDPQAA